MRKRGFTLIELLAVIAIVSVISLITVPMVMSYVEAANKSAFTTGAQNVFEAAKLYVSRVEEIGEVPEEGISISELKNELDHYDYISGVVLKQSDGSIIVDGLSNGEYCASGTKNDLRVVKGNCSNLDTTPPTLKVLLNKRTANSITILASATDATSGIYGYSYSTDGINYTEISNQNIYTINGLNKGEVVKIYVRAYNNIYDETNSSENLSLSMTEKYVEFTTLEIEKPKFIVSTSASSASTVKLVDIIYPKNDNGYEYTYEIDGKEEKVTEETVRLTITNNTIIKARIKTSTETIESELRIAGLDNEAPIANVVYNQKWERNKKIKVEVTYEQTGLPDEPYSFDGGKTWTSNNEKVYVTGENVTDKIKVRDVLGNITDKLTVNGKDTEEIIIDYIDNEKPTCTLKVLKGNLGLNDWYTSNVEIGFKETVDVAKYCLNGVCEDKPQGSGIKKSNIDITKIDKDGTTTVTGTVEDNMGNTGTCSLVIKKDSTNLSIVAKNSTVNLKYQGDYKLIDLFNINSYGPSGGTTTCYLIQNNKRTKTVTNNSELTLGINIIECEMVTGTGISKSAKATIKHNYNATPTGCTSGTFNGTTCHFDSDASVCGTEQKTETIQEYSSCAYTVNTCKYGCDSVWNPNINCTTVQDTSNCLQLKCSLYKTCMHYNITCTCKTSYGASTSTLCFSTSNIAQPNLSSQMNSANSICSNYCPSGKYACQTPPIGQKQVAACGSETVYDNARCAGKSSATCTQYGTKQVCAGGYENKNCSNCKTGSPNECRAGYVDKTTTQTVAKSCDKTDYLKYSCSTSGTNTSTNATINATMTGSTCQF